METRFTFQGSGGSLFWRFFGGMLLSAMTLGLYGPWFAVGMAGWTCRNTRLATPRGEVRFDFTGGGGRLLGLLLVNGLLTALTLGLYLPWALVDTARYVADGIEARGPDGRPWRLRFDATGGEAFPVVLKGVLLTVLTLGIYAPWFVCALARWFAARTTLLQDGALAGTATFDGTGDEFFPTLLLGIVLTAVTFGLYGPWFQVSEWRFLNGHTHVALGGTRWTGGFAASGWDWFVVLLRGGLLTLLTLGIYVPWYLASVIRFRLEATTLVSSGVAVPGTPDRFSPRPA